MKFMKAVFHTLVISIVMALVITGDGKCDTMTSISTFTIGPQMINTPQTVSSNVQLFDPSLGILNSVSVNLSGNIQISGSTIPYGYYDSSGNFVPLVSTVISTITQDFGGLFELSTYSTPIVGTAMGYGTYIPTLSSFSYDFTFNDVTDAAGFATYASTLFLPGTVSGVLDDFISSGISTGLLSATQTFTNISTVHGIEPLIQAMTVGTILQIDYDYTPVWDTENPPDIIDGVVIPPDGNPVPEPATMLLFGSGIAGLAGSRLRRKKRA